MTLWTTILLSAAACFALKVSGYLLPGHWLERPGLTRLTALVTVALLSALVAVQAVGQGAQVVLDARVPALAVAAVLLWRDAPFVVVVTAAAGVAALIRLL